MKDQEILNFISEKYKNISHLSYDEILKKFDDPQGLKGTRKDVISDFSDSLFFIGTRKGTEIGSIFEFSKENKEINVLSFRYLKSFPPKKIAS